MALVRRNGGVGSAIFILASIAIHVRYAAGVSAAQLQALPSINVNWVTGCSTNTLISGMSHESGTEARRRRWRCRARQWCWCRGRRVGGRRRGGWRCGLTHDMAYVVRWDQIRQLAVRRAAPRVNVAPRAVVTGATIPVSIRCAIACTRELRGGGRLVGGWGCCLKTTYRARRMHGGPQNDMLSFTEQGQN